jgi:hypothetical protein
MPSFFDLPPEIRLQVYIFIFPPHYRRLRSSRPSTASISAFPLLTSRVFRAEASPIFYANATFHTATSSDATAFLSAITTTHIPHLRYLYFDAKLPQDAGCYVDVLRVLTEGEARLESLSVWQPRRARMEGDGDEERAYRDLEKALGAFERMRLLEVNVVFPEAFSEADPESYSVLVKNAERWRKCQYVAFALFLG